MIAGLPCSREIVCQHAVGSNPGDLHITRQRVMLMLPSPTSLLGQPSRLFSEFRGKSVHITLRPTDVLSTLHDTCSTPFQLCPPIAQDSVSNCWLSFARAGISTCPISRASWRASGIGGIRYFSEHHPPHRTHRADFQQWALQPWVYSNAIFCNLS